MSPEPHQSDRSSPGKRLATVAGVVALGAVTGVAAALLANAFVAAIHLLNDTLLISPRSRMMTPHQGLLVAATVAVPTLGGLAVGLLHRMIRERRAHAPAEVIAAVQTRRGRLPGRPAFLSGLSSLVSLGSGASVGQYGPLVHLGGSLGSLIARIFRAGVTADNIAIACGVAAAISTVFNAPIAGILFAHEVILRHFALRAFAPVAVAAIGGHVVANAILPQPPLFQIDSATLGPLWEFGAFLVLGLACALVAVVYMKSILEVGRLAPATRIPALFRPAVAGCALGITALWVPEILGIGSETLRFAFIPGAYATPELALVLVLKIAATALCLGMGFAGGVFSPALVIGSLFGALFGTGMLLIPGAGSDLVVYAVCGMVAVTAPVIGAPLTTVVIVFELTGNYELTIAALASVALANLAASRMFGRSLFDKQLAGRGLDLSTGRSRALLETRTLKPLISDRYVRLAPDATVDAAREAMGEAHSADAYLVGRRGRYRGTVRLQEVVNEPAEAPASRYINAEDVVLTGETTIWQAMERLRDFVGEGVPVIDDRRRLLGTVFESDLISAYLRTLAEMREEEHAAG